MEATSGGDEWEIENDEGFVYKRPRVLYPVGGEDAGAAAASSTPASTAKSIRLQRRRRALLRLRDKYLAELSQWESLSSDLVPVPTPSAAPSVAPSATPLPVTASVATISADHTVLDDLIAEAEVQGEIFKKASEMCDEITEFCNEYEAAIVDAVTTLPAWGNPRELMKSLCSQDEQATVLPARGDPRELMNLLSSPAEQTALGIN